MKLGNNIMTDLHSESSTSLDIRLFNNISNRNIREKLRRSLWNPLRNAPSSSIDISRNIMNELIAINRSENK